jgi:hypothetical protein
MVAAFSGGLEDEPMVFRLAAFACDGNHNVARRTNTAVIAL